jgi:SnoaL-like domain
VEESPFAGLLAAVDQLDHDAVMALCAENCYMTTNDGRHAEGRQAVGQLLKDFFSQLRSTTHRITSQWHDGGTWIAEVLATYELRDFLLIEDLPRAFFVQVADDGIASVRTYGANERPLSDHATGDELTRVGGRPFLPL